MIKLNSLDHKASIVDREEFAELVRNHLPDYYVLLETCDRVELYFESDPDTPYPVPLPVVRHLFRLTAGLESPLLGECQILSQVKKAYREAVEAKRASSALHHLFQRALKVGKKVRSETEISKGALSHGQAAVEILKNKDIDISQSRITIIGVNHLNRNVIRYLVKSGAKAVFLGNRTLEKALELAGEFGCQAFSLNSLPLILKDTDILISATSSPHLIVRKEIFPEGKPMMIIDLAVPRDVDAEIGKLPGVTLLNVADVESMVNRNRSFRESLVGQADKIVENQTIFFIKEMEMRYAKYTKII